MDVSGFDKVKQDLARMESKRGSVSVDELDTAEHDLTDATDAARDSGTPIYKYAAYTDLMDSLEDVRSAHTYEKEQVSGDATAKIHSALKSMDTAIDKLSFDKPAYDVHQYNQDGSRKPDRHQQQASATSSSTDADGSVNDDPVHGSSDTSAPIQASDDGDGN